MPTFGTPLRKLKETLSELHNAEKAMEDDNVTLHTPSNIENCCSLQALKCFRESLANRTNTQAVRKLFKSLGKNLTIQGLDFCSTGSASPNCPPCESYPKADTKTFYQNLKTFIQKGISRLNMKE